MKWFKLKCTLGSGRKGGDLRNAECPLEKFLSSLCQRMSDFLACRFHSGRTKLVKEHIFTLACPLLKVIFWIKKKSPLLPLNFCPQTKKRPACRHYLEAFSNFVDPFFLARSQGGLREMNPKTSPHSRHGSSLWWRWGISTGSCWQRSGHRVQYQPEDASSPSHRLSPGASGRPRCYRSSRFAHGCCEGWPFYPPVGLIWHRTRVRSVRFYSDCLDWRVSGSVFGSLFPNSKMKLWARNFSLKCYHPSWVL